MYCLINNTSLLRPYSLSCMHVLSLSHFFAHTLCISYSNASLTPMSLCIYTCVYMCMSFYIDTRLFGYLFLLNSNVIEMPWSELGIVDKCAFFNLWHVWTLLGDINLIIASASSLHNANHFTFKAHRYALVGRVRVRMSEIHLHRITHTHTHSLALSLSVLLIYLPS